MVEVEVPVSIALPGCFSSEKDMEAAVEGGQGRGDPTSHLRAAQKTVDPIQQVQLGIVRGAPPPSFQ